MGLHFPLNYVLEERPALDTFIFLLDTWCKGCHTNHDFSKGCQECPFGNVILEVKKYLLEADKYSTSCKTYKKIINKIAKNIKDINPEPFFSTKLNKLSKNLEEIDNYNIKLIHKLTKYKGDKND
jgi:hypothetical protein